MKVKKENAGRRKREGRVKSSKVLKIVGCQVQVMPVIRPGRKSAAKFKLSVSTGSEREKKWKSEKKSILLKSVRRQARKITINLGERNPSKQPPSGSTLQTPTWAN